MFNFSGNFPETFRKLRTRSARPERTTRRPRTSRRVPRARPGHPPRRSQPLFETKSHPSRHRAGFRKKQIRGSKFNFSGNFPETPDGVFGGCTDAPEHPRGSAKPPRASAPPPGPTPTPEGGPGPPDRMSPAFPENGDLRRSRSNFPERFRKPRAASAPPAAPKPRARAGARSARLGPSGTARRRT